MVQGKDYKPLIIHKLLLHEIAMKNSLCHFTVYLPCMFAALSGQRPYRNVYIFHQMKHTLIFKWGRKCDNKSDTHLVNQCPKSGRWAHWTPVWFKDRSSRQQIRMTHGVAKLIHLSEPFMNSDEEVALPSFELLAAGMSIFLHSQVSPILSKFCFKLVLYWGSHSFRRK